MSKDAKPSEAKKSLKKMHKFLGAKFMKAVLKRLKTKKALTAAAPSAEPIAATTGADVEGPFALGESADLE